MTPVIDELLATRESENPCSTCHWSFSCLILRNHLDLWWYCLVNQYQYCQFEEATTRLAQGDLRHQVKLEVQDELGRLRTTSIKWRIVWLQPCAKSPPAGDVAQGSELLCM